MEKDNPTPRDKKPEGKDSNSPRQDEKDDGP
jgi:hypothetical protein